MPLPQSYSESAQGRAQPRINTHAMKKIQPPAHSKRAAGERQERVNTEVSLAEMESWDLGPSQGRLF